MLTLSGGDTELQAPLHIFDLLRFEFHVWYFHTHCSKLDCQEPEINPRAFDQVSTEQSKNINAKWRPRGSLALLICEASIACDHKLVISPRLFQSAQTIHIFMREYTLFKKGFVLDIDTCEHGDSLEG